jgi:hypothetical protein
MTLSTCCDSSSAAFPVPHPRSATIQSGGRTAPEQLGADVVPFAGDASEIGLAVLLAGVEHCFEATIVLLEVRSRSGLGSDAHPDAPRRFG